MSDTNSTLTPADFGSAYQSGFKRTTAFLLSRGVIADIADEIAQAAWVRGWERLSQLRDRRMLLPWVNTIAWNQYRRTLRVGRREEVLEEPDRLPSRGGQNLARIDVGRILDRCHTKHRAMLQAQLEGRTANELAKDEGVSPTAIRIRMFRARRVARGYVEDGQAATAAA